MTVNPIDQLDDRSTLLAVQYLAEDLQGGRPTVVQSEAEARHVLSSLLAQADIPNASPDDLLPSQDVALAAARRALVALNDDAITHTLTAGLLAEPPEDEQMSVEAALAATAVLALLITWLQTKVVLRIRRKGGKTEVDFTIDKQATDGQTLREIATALGAVLGLPTSVDPSTPGSDQENAPR
ncbi:hypothetical protein [Streptomyces sp. NPDC058457]|uniref:hypothetical protein n=1 Tax=Streptomyces sp. NPDC058457 TaxID=3346507 RepID=UPI0036694BAF